MSDPTPSSALPAAQSDVPVTNEVPASQGDATVTNEVPVSPDDAPITNEEAQEAENDSNMEDEDLESKIWTAKERAILKANVAGYRAAARKTKAAYIVNTVIPAIKEAWNGRYSKKNMNTDTKAKAEWASKKKVSLRGRPGSDVQNLIHLQSIFNWFPNNAATERRMRIPGFNYSATFERVFREKKKKEINEEVKRQAGGSTKSRDWLPFYSGARKVVRDKLTLEEKAQYNKDLEEWKLKGLPKSVQAECVLLASSMVIFGH